MEISYKQKKFLKSLAWNVGMFSLAFVIDTLATNLGIFNLSPEMTGLLGVVLGRLSKVVNNKIKDKKAENERY